MGCSWFNTETNKRKTSINNKNSIKYIDKKSPSKNLQISSCSIATLSHVRVCTLSSRYVFSWNPFYFDFHSARIIFDVSSGFYLLNINNMKADICKK